MSLRHEFVTLAQVPGAPILRLCQAFGISRKTGYKWLARFQAEGADGLADRSRRPITSPRQSVPAVEAQVLALHEAYPCWGSRKLHALLPDDQPRPHPSTIDAILKRHGRTIEGTAKPPVAPLRFEHDAPNQLWQMDFKGYFPLTDTGAGRCYPLTVLDDHSRFSLCLAACGNEKRTTVQPLLIETFRRYGLPERITADNGNPWGDPTGKGLSTLEAWLIRLGIRVSHSRPYHPQTQGKDERFHRTLKRELLQRQGFSSLAACQHAFDRWREQYNLIRPHEALGQKPPASRYQVSGRPYPEQLPSIEYEPDDRVLKVYRPGIIVLKGKSYFVSEGLVGEYVALRPTATDGVHTVFYCHKAMRDIDFRKAK